MRVNARDVVQVGMVNLDNVEYRICTMTLYGKATVDDAKANATDKSGNLSFTSKTKDGESYSLFNDTVIAQGSVYVDITKDASKRYWLFSQDDAGTTDEWQ